MAAWLHMNQAMLAWAGSAVSVEEAFPDAAAQEEYVRHADAEGLHRHISANTRLHLYYHDSNNGQRQVLARAIEVGVLGTERFQLQGRTPYARFARSRTLNPFSPLIVFGERISFRHLPRAVKAFRSAYPLSAL
jgi:hypothetical protein